jgi:hypothetical protein
LEFIIYDYTDKKQCDKVLKRLVKCGGVEHEVKAMMETSQGLFVGGNPYVVAVDINCYDLTKVSGIIELLKTISHECGHVRGELLRDINEQVKSTDSEAYLRISDWAFKKCLGTKFIKSLLSSTKKDK